VLDERGPDLIFNPCYASVGANVGDREAAVLGVPRAIEESGAGRCVRISSLYETAPVGCAPMGFFVNAVVEFESLLCPEDLLKRFKAIEKSAGRSGGHNEPRELDLDIIAIGDAAIRTDALTVPHPSYRERAFVIVPLMELAPDFVCPETGRRIAELVSSVSGTQGIVKVSSRRAVLA
jgi:2-amino-4-hydroxy-6-hydroxymethyldihydropteridine diphosphokinase